ncbi:MAG: HAMP domain-containing histidine kinase [Spirochaetales bacterium]|nr:HAMP domain-containing histidine kinase [Spirochaetales bacterium]
MKSFELDPQASGPPHTPAPRGLGGPVLLNNALWFMRLRWIVVAIFATVGLAGRLLRAPLQQVGLVVPFRGLWILAAVLSLTNVVFHLMARRSRARSSYALVRTNIWLQIVSDLLVVSILVHMVGSTYTFIPFIYLFHITLSCIFFPKRESLAVILIATGLYLMTVGLESAGLWASPGIVLSAPTLFGHGQPVESIFALSAVVLWYVEWYLISSLSEVLRLRDQQLSAANRRLRRADEEKTRQVLLTTHDLKAPFAGIESNIQILKLQHWDEISRPVREIIERIDQRAHTLRERIQDILLLGDLKSRGKKGSVPVSLDLQRSVEQVVKELREKAESRKVRLEVRVPALRVLGDPEQVLMLISNLVTNAILYSRESGAVAVRAEEEAAAIRLSVSDRGIGIRPEALPHIFEEYYRTREAARFNRNSTGLGLAIVREVAQNLKLRIRVSSELGKGTTFEVYFPRSRQRHEEEDIWQESK